MSPITFDPAKDIPSLAGKVILVTGGTAGLGRETVLSFAAHQPSHIFFTGRSQPSANAVLSETASTYPGVPISFIKCDLASFASIQEAARTILSKTTRLDIVMANAGIMAVPPGLTKEGYEIQFGTNHVGHALLVKLLTPMLSATAKKHGDARAIWDSSLGYKTHPRGGIHFETLKTTQADIFPVVGSWLRYGQSKLANLLYARAFAKHNPSITSVSIHPGVSYTGLVTGLSLAQRLFIYATTYFQVISAETCAHNQQWAATASLGEGDMQVESGKYYEPVGVKGVLAREADNDVLAERLWEWTQEELKAYDLGSC